MQAYTTIVFLLWASLLGYLLEIPILMTNIFIIYQFVILWAVHYTGHRNLWKLWFQAHEGHHTIYPGNNMLSIEYRPNKYDKYHLNTYTYLFAWQLSSLPMLAIINKDCYLLGQFIVLIALCLENAVHEALHCKNTIVYYLMNTFTPNYYRYLYHAHMLHHQHKYYNYAVTALWLDQAYGTYLE